MHIHTVRCRRLLVVSLCHTKVALRSRWCLFVWQGRQDCHGVVSFKKLVRGKLVNFCYIFCEWYSRGLCNGFAIVKHAAMHLNNSTTSKKWHNDYFTMRTCVNEHTHVSIVRMYQNRMLYSTFGRLGTLRLLYHPFIFLQFVCFVKKYLKCVRFMTFLFNESDPTDLQ